MGLLALSKAPDPASRKSFVARTGEAARLHAVAWCRHGQTNSVR